MAADAAPSRPVRRRPAARAVHYLLLLAICALVANALVGESGFLATRLASRQESHLAARIADMKAQNAELREHARRLREDPAFLEEVARREFGLIRPGERVFILHPAPGETDAVTPDVEPGGATATVTPDAAAGGEAAAATPDAAAGREAAAVTPDAGR